MFCRTSKKRCNYYLCLNKMQIRGKYVMKNNKKKLIILLTQTKVIQSPALVIYIQCKMRDNLRLLKTNQLPLVIHWTVNGRNIN